MANYLQANQPEEIKKIGDYIPSIVQLLVVLPKESIELIPNKYRKYMLDVKYGLIHLYPEKYKICTYLKTHLWECNPVLPQINIEYIKALIMKN
jgi:5'-3' exonuclease